MTTKDDGVKAVDTALRIVNRLQQLDGAGVSELAGHEGLAKSTVHRHLTTLEKNDYVVKEDGQYHLGLRFFNHGEYTVQENEIYPHVAPVVDDVAEQTTERALFGVAEHGRVYYLYRSIGSRAVENPEIGCMRYYMHQLASGKAILAHLPERRVHEIIDRWGLPRKTENTITDRDELLSELEEIREAGVAFNYEEAIPGLNALAVPILVDGEVQGALSVSGPARRLEGDRLENELPRLLSGATNELELKWQYR